TIAWPAKLGKTDRTAYRLYGSQDASLAVAEGAVTGADPIALTVIDGGLTDAQKQRFPALAGYLALRVPSDADVPALLRTQLAVAQTDTADELTAFTGVQIPGVLDDLYASKTADADLGVTFQGNKPTFRLWAPTVQSATLLTWSPGSGDGDPARHPADYDTAAGTWTVKGAN